MKKSLIALAIASAVSAPAFAATANVDVYGVMSFAVEDTDVSGSDIEVVDRVSRIGFKGAEDLGGGLSAIWQIEQQISATTGQTGKQFSYNTTITTPNADTLSLSASEGYDRGAFGGAGLRNTYIGLKSATLGTVLFGRHDTPYKLGTGALDLFGDTKADYNGMPDGVALIDAVHDYRSPQAIAYISPTWSGLHFAVAGIATNDGPWYDASGEVWTSTSFTSGSLNVGKLDNGDSIDAVSATVIYANGPLFASLSYQDVDVADSTAWKAGLGYTFGNFKLGAAYEKVDNYVTTSIYNTNAAGTTINVNGCLIDTCDRDSWFVNGAFTMGAIVLKGEYGQVNLDNVSYRSTDSGTTWARTAAEREQAAYALGADYLFSKRTLAYVLYTNGDNDVGDDVSGWALGMKHSF